MTFSEAERTYEITVEEKKEFRKIDACTKAHSLFLKIRFVYRHISFGEYQTARGNDQ